MKMARPLSRHFGVFAALTLSLVLAVAGFANPTLANERGSATIGFYDSDGTPRPATEFFADAVIDTGSFTTESPLPRAIAWASSPQTEIILSISDGTQILWSSSIPEASGSFQFAPTPTTPGRYTFTVDPRGAQPISTQITVHAGWAPLVRDTRLTFPRCGSVSWAYNNRGEPAGAGSVKADIARAFEDFGPATGLGFIEAPIQSAQIVFSWVSNNDGYSARAEANYTYEIDEAIILLNARVPMMSKAGFGERARGGTIIHEIAHALGLGHVSDPRSLMTNPPFRTSFYQALQPSDRLGLEALYEPSSCPSFAAGSISNTKLQPGPISPLETQQMLSAWAKRLGPAEAKFYAKNPVGWGKVQFLLNGKEIAWVNAIDASDPKLAQASGSNYLVRTAQLLPGKNVLQILIAGQEAKRVVYTR